MKKSVSILQIAKIPDLLHSIVIACIFCGMKYIVHLHDLNWECPLRKATVVVACTVYGSTINAREFIKNFCKTMVQQFRVLGNVIVFPKLKAFKKPHITAT